MYPSDSIATISPQHSRPTCPDWVSPLPGFVLDYTSSHAYNAVVLVDAEQYESGTELEDRLSVVAVEPQRGETVQTGDGSFEAFHGRITFQDKKMWCLVLEAPHAIAPARWGTYNWRSAYANTRFNCLRADGEDACSEISAHMSFQLLPYGRRRYRKVMTNLTHVKSKYKYAS